MVTENGTKDSFARAPKTPHTGNSQQRRKQQADDHCHQEEAFAGVHQTRQLSVCDGKI